MKRSLSAILIENSKTSKKANGELSKPAVEKLNAPDNHVGSKKKKTVDGKRGLGDRKDSKKVAQVVPPKMKERRSMKEGLAHPDSKAGFKFSSAKNKDEGLPTPNVAKVKGTRTGKAASTISGTKNNPANIGKTRKLDKSYVGGIPAPVAKVKESLEELADFLQTPISIDSNLVENYPDGMNWDAFDADDEDDSAAVEDMKYATVDFLKKEGHGYVEVYKKYKNDPRAESDPTWYLENLSGMAESAYEVAAETMRSANDNFEVDNSVVNKILTSYMKKSGVPSEDIQSALSDYTDVSEDYFQSNGSKMDRLTHNLNTRGYEKIRGVSGGPTNYRNKFGDTVSVSTDMRNPDQIVSWTAKINNQQSNGKDTQSLMQTVYGMGGAKKPEGKPSPFRKSPTKSKSLFNGDVDEMSSGGAVSSGSVVSNGKSDLFADTEVHEGDPCWDSHEMVGMKKKGGKDVPNCVPKKKTNESRYGLWSSK